MDAKSNAIESHNSHDEKDGQIIHSGAFIKPQARKLHDENVTLEEYFYYAQKTREEEKALEPPQLRWAEIINRKKPSPDDANAVAEKSHVEVNFTDPKTRAKISDEEWINASRAMRTASWGAAFYLVSPPLVQQVCIHVNNIIIRSRPTSSAHMA